MTEPLQEIMTTVEAAEWFRRSVSWLRQQPELLRLGGPRGQPLYHVRLCRAYILGRLRGARGDALREVQLQALAAACALDADVDRGPPALPRKRPVMTVRSAAVRPPTPTLPSSPECARKSPAR
jgi:hypothetical protein